MPAELRAPAPPVVITGDGASFVFTQDVASSVWNVNHSLGYRPAVTVVDTLDREFEADVEYVDDDHVTISFGIASTGKAYFS